MLEHAVWWHVYPLGALGAPIRGEHGAPEPRLRRLEAWLDYAVELGCNGLLLNPVFASVAHGYETLDHYRIDPRLGDTEDFDALVAAAASRGLHVVLDGVFNHVAREHPLVAARPDMIRWQGDQPKGWEGHSDLVELNHDHPEVRAMVADIMAHWLRRGVAGWRLDVAYAVPADFWRDVLGRVRAEFPSAIFLGEVIHGDYAVIARDSTFDSVTQYELWKAIWSSLVDRNGWELAHAIERHAAFSAEFIPNTFTGNHDVSRMASLVEPHQLPITPYLLTTLPGAPSVYYGDEQGFTGLKTDRLGGDDDVRPPLPASPADLSALGAGMLHHYQAAIALRRRNPWLATADVEVTRRANEAISYRVTGSGNTLDVHIDLVGGGVTIEGSGEHLVV
ncbi:alpha-amylase family protein [Tessaracoccus flavus]|uniref:Alpha-amylase n=1 Tax=Tessaracoccus flavus TaxID=1610493 RepID=A0A1Q2CBH4_9ACTN|nr:alpha-amylase family protein [Tessaracoccus flavus]AQP43463.1 alpha-amylase [Tessaracoccus flavus]SDY84334.1 Glycosidase [Tessaracoccus flavus]